jgi:hypothetical protein
MLSGTCLGVERVMGIEPIWDFRQINMLAASAQASAIQVRDFTALGALPGNVRQYVEPVVLSRGGATVAMATPG